MKKTILLVILILLAPCSLTVAFAEQADSLKKFILKTDSNSSSDGVELRLVINHGSLSEKDNERGFAHLVEHIAFNDTAKYPNESLIPFLEKAGLSLGIHSNAATGFDSTIYRLNLQNPDAKTLELAIDVLSQWAMHVQFNQQVIDAEKPVIKEEWRVSQPYEKSWGRKVFKTDYANSHYLNRESIGDMQIVESALAKDLEAFYKRWYQPQNAAIIVTGNIDQKQVNTLVDQYFGQWTSSSKTKQTKYFLPFQSIPKLQVISDASTDSSFVSINFYQQLSRANDEAGAYQDLLTQGGLHILNQRLYARLYETQGAVKSASAYTYYLTPDVMKVVFTASLSGGQIDTGLQLLKNQINQFFQEGITQAELDNMRRSLLDILRLDQENAPGLASMAQDHFLLNTPLLRHTSRLKDLEKRLPSLTVKAVNEAVHRLVAKQPAKLLVVHTPTVTPPADEDLLALADKVDVTQNLASTTESDIKTEQRWAITPKNRGELIQTTRFKNGLIQWKFSNNTTAVFKQDNSQPNKIYYILADTHGSRYLTEEQTIHARLAMETMGGSGLRDLSGPELSQWLDNNVISLYPFYSFWNKGLKGSFASKNFTTAMNLLHVLLTEARVSPSARDHFLEWNKQQLLQLDKSNMATWADIMSERIYQNDAAFRTLTLDELESTTVSDMEALYQQSFSGAQQYRLSLVGDISEKEALRVVKKTIATLPKSVIPTGKPREFPRIASPEASNFKASDSKAATISHKLTLAKTALPDVGFREVSYLHNWLRSVLMAELREKEGLVYSVDVTVEGGINDLKDYTLTIDLECDPDKLDKLKTTLARVLQQQSTTPVTSEQAEVWVKEARSQLERYLSHAETLVSEINNVPLVWVSLEDVMDIDLRTQLKNPKVLNEVLSAFLSDKAIPTTLVRMP